MGASNLLHLIRRAQAADALIGTIKDYAIFVLDTSGFVQSWNEGARRIKGYTSSEIIGQHFSKFYLPEDILRHHPEHELALALRNGRHEEEGWRLRKDGSMFWASVFINRIDSDDGTTLGFVKITRDLSDRKRVEDGLDTRVRERTVELSNTQRALEESEALLRSFANAIPQLGWIARADGHITWYNDRWYEYTGRTPKEMEGWGWQSVHHPHHLGPVLENWKRTLASGCAFEMEFPLLGKDGEYRWFLTRINPVRDRAGELMMWFGTNTDIDHQKRAMVELENLVRTRDEFISVASHELKTPLTSLKLQNQTYSRLLERKGFGAIDERQFGEILRVNASQIERLSKLVDDMLDISRIQSGRLNLLKCEVNLIELAGDTVRRLGLQFSENGYKVHVSGEEGCFCQCDQGRIEQVLSNLLTNAIRYGRGNPIEVKVANDGNMVEIRVADGGHGVKAEDRERIFERFERAVDSSEVSGMGLGLFISKQIVVEHGGLIGLDSEIDKGSTFWFKLPRG